MLGYPDTPFLIVKEQNKEKSLSKIGKLMIDKPTALIKWLLLKQMFVLNQWNNNEINQKNLAKNISMYCWVTTCILSSKFNQKRFKKIVINTEMETTSLLDKGAEFFNSIGIKQRE